MKPFRFNKEKDQWLKKNRNMSFAKIVIAIEKDGLIKNIPNPNKKKYPNQRLFLVTFNNYIFIVPVVEEEEYFFLKTIFPSRKYTNIYLKVEK